MLKFFKHRFRLCPLLSLALATMGCGKKINDAETTQGARKVENQEPSSTLIIRLDPGQTKKAYENKQNANAYLPEALYVKSGNVADKTVTIFYNLDDAQDENFEYKCSYKYASDTPNVMPLDKCENAYGGTFHNLSGYQFPFYFGKIIKMEISGGANNATVDANYSVDWI